MHHPTKFYISSKLNKKVVGCMMKTINDVVVERICKYMGEENLTQYRLAQLRGKPFPTLKSIMQRRTKGITLKTIIMLCNGLNITPSQFLDCPDFLANNLNMD